MPLEPLGLALHLGYPWGTDSAWALPCSLAVTRSIAVAFFSSAE